MASRPRGRRLPPPHPPLIQEILDDDLFDVEVNYSDEEEEEEEEESDEEESESEDNEPEEVVPGQESIGEGCGPAIQARVSGAAAEKNACPVCMEAWASQGAHRIWFRPKDITNLYAPEVAVPNNDLEKEVLYLRGKAESLGETVMKHEKLIEEMNERLVELTSAQKRQILSEQRLMNVGSSKRQKEFFMDGLRVMAIDAFNQTILASGKAPGIGQEHVLYKFSMVSHHEARNIQLPLDTKTVRDICILPSGSAIFTSLGRKLSSFSMTADRVVLQCDLPCPGWSCSADESSRQICAGLQNGNLIIFDIRQTSRPLHSMVGLSTHPVHTLHTVIDNNGSRKFLSASSIGPCMWDTDGIQGRPKLLLGTDNQRVCISLACAPSSSDLLVASFRPKVETSEDATASQVYLSQTPTPSGGGKLGYHSFIRRAGNSSSFTEDRTCSTLVSEIRMSKSAIIPYGNNQHLFAYGDESLRGVRTWRLPSFEMHSDLSSLQQPVLDLRYAESSSGGRYLGYLSTEKLQVFRIR
ncbi:Os03g0108200 [Oryza sativa Japonica Group]|uniref:RING-type E3 ubiquitin transferase n=1 Tax=Oryza sativa subsp. japonica TaxID=39947 RepID=C7J0J0_ORYSJ|nr:Os03g0108200 [Oryza sativa Japonica Group]|eukprot:NP_001173231.1 Os03g0108200 [Oryza sativa Japonica Group]